MKARIVMIIMAVALIALPTMAQTMEWQSTSTMQGTGTYTAPVTEVGATTVPSEATTTYSPAKVGPRRDKERPGEVGYTGEQGSPVGDALIPLMLCALAFCGVVYYRRRKALKS